MNPGTKLPRIATDRFEATEIGTAAWVTYLYQWCTHDTKGWETIPYNRYDEAVDIAVVRIIHCAISRQFYGPGRSKPQSKAITMLRLFIRVRIVLHLLQVVYHDLLLLLNRCPTKTESRHVRPTRTGGKLGRNEENTAIVYCTSEVGGTEVPRRKGFLSRCGRRVRGIPPSRVCISRHTYIHARRVCFFKKMRPCFLRVSRVECALNGQHNPSRTSPACALHDTSGRPGIHEKVIMALEEARVSILEFEVFPNFERNAKPRKQLGSSPQPQPIAKPSLDPLVVRVCQEIQIRHSVSGGKSGLRAACVSLPALQGQLDTIIIDDSENPNDGMAWAGSVSIHCFSECSILDI